MTTVARSLALLSLLVACGDKSSDSSSDSGSGGALADFSLDRVVPESGSASGGDALTLTGSGFTSGTRVDVGGSPCASLALISAVELACTTPPGGVGPTMIQAVRAEDSAIGSVAFTYEEGGGGDGGGDGGSDGGGDGGSDGGGDGGSDGGGDGGSDGGGDGGSDGGGDGGSDGGGDGGSDGGGDGGASTPVDYCHVQWPCSMTASAGATSESLYVWVFQAGVTEGAGEGAGVDVELGHGPDGSDPGAGGWTWTSATYNVDKDGLGVGDLANDEYTGAFTCPSASGAYDYAARVSVDAGTSWTSCDLGGDSCGGSGSGDGYDASTTGDLVIE